MHDRESIRMIIHDAIAATPSLGLDSLTEWEVATVAAEAVVKAGVGPRRITASSRRGDPSTSQEAAAEAVARSNARLAAGSPNEHSRIIDLLHLRGDATREQLADALGDLHAPSRVRTAVKDLITAGLVAPTGATRHTRRGRRAEVLGLTQKATRK